MSVNLNRMIIIKFQALFKKYRDVFAYPGDQLGRTSLVQHVIDTGDAVPIKQRPYRTSPEGKKEIDRQVKDLDVNSKIVFLFNNIDAFICRSVAAFVYDITNYRNTMLFRN